MPVNKQGRFYRSREGVPSKDVAAATVNTTSTLAAFDVEDAHALVATLSIGTVTGTTPTLDVVLEQSIDGTNWDTVAAFPQKTAAAASSSHTRIFGPLAPGAQLRWRRTVGGTTPVFNSVAIAHEAIV